MKIFILFSIFLLPSSMLFAQTDSTYIGKWTCTVDAGSKGKQTSYVFLKQDSTFIAGVDSSFTDISKQSAKGKWCVMNGDLKLIPVDTSMDTHYFRHMDHWKFHYYMNEKHGKMELVHLMEMDIYMEKIVPVAKGKKRVKAKY